MKSFGSILAFTKERNNALLMAYRRELRNTKKILLRDIGERIVNSPSPRFWVSEERAASVVSALLRGKPVLLSMRRSKREMFEEIHRRVIGLKEKHPGKTLITIVRSVVNSPAPKFYMEPSSAIERLFKIRNGWYERRGAKQAD